MEAINFDRAASHLSVIREMIQQENTLISQRLGWMFTLQGLLFGATGFVWGRSQWLVAGLGFVGLASSLSIGYSLERGFVAIKELLAIASDFKKNLPPGMVFPPTIGSRSKAIEWLLPGRLLPWVLGVAWVAAIAYRLAG